MSDNRTDKEVTEDILKGYRQLTKENRVKMLNMISDMLYAKGDTKGVEEIQRFIQKYLQ